MIKVPTIKEIICKKYNIENYQEVALYGNNLKEMIVTITKLHCKAQLSAILENVEVVNKAKFKGDCNPQIDEDSIKNAYSFDNII